MEIKEGYMPFMGYQTYYRIVDPDGCFDEASHVFDGDKTKNAGGCEAKAKKGKSPIILLHGGPGSTHNYFELLDRVALSGRAVISYDQLGCGNSFVEGIPSYGLPGRGSMSYAPSSTICISTASISWDSRGAVCSTSSISSKNRLGA